MGEVYRARDTKLGRDVAIKVLPEEFFEEKERIARFEQEAKSLAAVSHPHIAALYSFEEISGRHLLVMELVEGETLMDRLLKGPLLPDQVLKTGIEIASALDAAHRAGIVHRDLKPGNVMLTKSGVKLLDFGLAKALAPEGTVESLTSAPTTARDVTREGEILGTLSYMAPEQLEGKKPDSRTDIFALGATLYETATGRKTFTGTSQASLITAIMTSEPQPISVVQPMTPPALDRVVKTCLAKDPDDRWQSAHDVKLQIQSIADGGSQAGLPATLVAPRESRGRLAWCLAGICLAAAVVLAVVHFRQARIEARPTRFILLPPEQTTFAIGPAAPQAAVSPDGHYVAFAATTSDRKTHLWLRPLDSLAAQRLVGTEDAGLPFWSPDSRFIGFFAQGKLKRIDPFGGPPQTLCDAPAGNGGTWNREGLIVFAPNREGALARVSATGGIPAAATALDRRRQETGHAWPQFLPDGRRFLFLALSGQRENRGLYVGSVGSEGARRVLKTEVRSVYAPPGYLLFLQQGTLMAQWCNPDRLELSGEPVAVAEGVAYNSFNGRDTFSVSENGVLVYRTGRLGGLPTSELVWFDRGGKRIGSVEGPGMYLRPALSPDGKRIAVERIDPQTGAHDIWLVDPALSTFLRLTFGSSNQTHPVWSPDGSRIVFASDREGATNLYQKTSSGAGGEELLLRSETAKYVLDWSPDGRFIAYESQDPKTGTDLWMLPLFGDRKPFPLLQTEFNEGQGQFSPDGRWMAYVSDESGKREVYVQTFPASGGKWQISDAGGAYPRWRRDGKELFYVTAGQKLMAVTVQTDSTFQAGRPHALFEPRFFQPVIPYAVSADGQRFLVNTPLEEDNSSPVTVVLNWTAELKKR
jgi:Tol biopolymer transport system component/predicted Ser/Thr protein kinase